MWKKTNRTKIIHFEANIKVILSLRPLWGKNVVYDALHFCFTYESAAAIKTRQLENLIQFNSSYIFPFPENYVIW